MVFIGMKLLDNGIGEAPEYTLGIGTSIVLLLTVMWLLDRMDLIESNENSDENNHESDRT